MRVLERHLVVGFGSGVHTKPRGLCKQCGGDDNGIDGFERVAPANAAPDPQIPAARLLDPANMGRVIFRAGHFQHWERVGLSRRRHESRIPIAGQSSHSEGARQQKVARMSFDALYDFETHILPLPSTCTIVHRSPCRTGARQPVAANPDRFTAAAGTHSNPARYTASARACVRPLPSGAHHWPGWLQVTLAIPAPFRREG